MFNSKKSTAEKPSPWEESQAEGANAQPAAVPVEDGFGDTQAPGGDDDQGVVDAAPKRKGNPLLPKILAGVLCAVCLGVLGMFGMRLMGTMGPDKSTQVAKAQAQPMPASTPTDVPSSPRIATGTVLMADAVVSPPAAPAAPVVPSGAATTVAPAAVATSTSSVPVAVAVAQPQAPDPRVEKAEGRVRSLEAEVETLREQLARKETKANAAASARPVEAGRVAEVPKKRSTPNWQAKKPVEAALPVATDRVIAKAGGAESAASDASSKKASPEIARLQLRGVFPPSGEDMQAWVMDGDKTRAISRGDLINGAKVLRVETDRVITDLGIIR